MMDLTTTDRVRKFNNFMREFVDSYTLHSLLCKGFFETPASKKYHGNYPGGLFDHSYQVAKYLVDITHKLDLSWSNKRSPYIIGMYHDLWKLDTYNESGMDESGMDESGMDESGILYEYNKEQTLPGHGDKSILVLSTLMRLTEEEVYCIRYHMGAYEKDEWEYYDRAIRKYPNVLWTHTADMYASKIVGI